MTTVLFFPGQASQYVGMGKDLYEASPDVRRLYELASTELKADIARLSFEGPAEELKRTRFTQPAILLHSLAALTIAGEQLPEFDAAAGHSLGEYGALAVCGALSFEDAIRAVVRRATLMEAACVAQPGTMAAIIGLEAAAVEAVCTEASAAGVVVPANYNAPHQIVVSGSLAGVAKACELAKAAGAKRALPLEVGGAFHSPLMTSATKGLADFLSNVDIRKPSHPVLPNVTARPVTDPRELRNLLVAQVTAPVRWSQTMQWCAQHGITKVIEVGPGKVLAGMAKREIPGAECRNLDTLADLNALTPTVA